MLVLCAYCTSVSVRTAGQVGVWSVGPSLVARSGVWSSLGAPLTASPAQARQAQISRFLLVLGPEDVLALSKDTIGTAWASRVFFSKKYFSNGFFEFTLTDFLG